MDITRDAIVSHPGGRKYRIVSYGYYNALGIIGAMNGVAVLDEVNREVIADCIPKSKFDDLTEMEWPDFRAYINSSPRLRRAIH